MLDPLLRQILTSRVYEAAVETPLDPAPQLSAALGNEVLLKREDLQPVFSFKLRGAYNRMAQLAPGEGARGVIAASAGNHAQGVAFSARRLGLAATIVMPVTTPAIKVAAVRALEAHVVLHGDNYSEAAEHCARLATDLGLTFIHPFNDPLVIAGQGTIGAEILRQCGGRPHAIFVPVGGGGLIAGIAAYVKALAPEVRIIGVEPEDSDAMTRSLAAGRRITLDSVGIFADGVAVREVGDLTFSLCQRHVDDMVRVNTDALCGAIKANYLATRAIVEPAGALALAGLRSWVARHGVRGQRLVAVNSGANMNFERLGFVTERTLVGEAREALFAVTLPEQPGALKLFLNEIIGPRNITEFNYRLSSRSAAHVFVGISLNDPGERQDLARLLHEKGFKPVDFTEDELAKTHVRYMVGGRSAEVRNERLFRFWFPERPGALGRFLDPMGGTWNISLFHYRMHGGDHGRVLIGMEIPPGDEARLQAFLQELGYRFQEETNNPAYRLFL
ncbi:MAG: threonine ammonia-lyase, biosynthetic [Magnetococcus sp. WYHC-3]